LYKKNTRFIRLRTNEYDVIDAWIKKNIGKLCFIKKFEYDDLLCERITAEDRLIQAVATIQLSRALAEGWLDRNTLVEAHDLAWQTLIAIRDVTDLTRREQTVNDAAQALEQLVRHIAQLNHDLETREDTRELQRLKSQYLDIRQRTEALAENVKIARKFLADHPEP
jgi:hypothetical protein